MEEEAASRRCDPSGEVDTRSSPSCGGGGMCVLGRSRKRARSCAQLFGYFCRTFPGRERPRPPPLNSIPTHPLIIPPFQVHQLAAGLQPAANVESGCKTHLHAHRENTPLLFSRQPEGAQSGGLHPESSV